MYQEAYNLLGWGTRNAGRVHYSFDTTCSSGHLLIFMFKKSDKEKGFQYGRGVLMRGERRMWNVHT